MTRDQILTTLESGHQAIAAYVATLPETTFFSGHAARWSPAHHVGHLTMTHISVARGFPLKARLPIFDQPSRSYEDIQKLYTQALKSALPALLANNPFTPELKAEDTQAGLIEAFVYRGQELCKQITWSEHDLDSKAIKHPLLGLVSMREMIMFIAIHDRHHLEGIKHLA